METSKLDIYEKVTNQIIAAIEAGAGNFRMPWHAAAGESPLPVNAASKRGYRGINVLALWAAARAKGYASNVWATYKQWQELDAQVREGEKATLVVLWKFPERDEGEEEPAEANGRKKGRGVRPLRGVLARGYFVFNSGQVDGYKPPEVPALDPALRMEPVENFFAALDADIRFGGAEAYYRPDEDFIQMPEYRHFRDVESFYGTLAHEATHLSGAPGRLNRDLSTRFGSEAYAIEELVAELGAAFVCATLGISNEPRPDHAAYISSWLAALRRDKRAIFTAAAKAQAAVDWMHERQPAGELVGNMA
jgi:antirestriction protein ArdC